MAISPRSIIVTLAAALFATAAVAASSSTAQACGPTWSIEDRGLGFSVAFKNGAVMPKPPAAKRPASWGKTLYPFWFAGKDGGRFLTDTKRHRALPASKRVVDLRDDGIYVRGKRVGAVSGDAVVVNGVATDVAFKTLSKTKLVTTFAVQLTRAGEVVVDERVSVKGCSPSLRQPSALKRLMQTYAVWRDAVWGV